MVLGLRRWLKNQIQQILATLWGQHTVFRLKKRGVPPNSLFLYVVWYDMFGVILILLFRILRTRTNDHRLHDSVETLFLIFLKHERQTCIWRQIHTGCRSAICWALWMHSSITGCVSNWIDLGLCLRIGLGLVIFSTRIINKPTWNGLVFYFKICFYSIILQSYILTYYAQVQRLIDPNYNPVRQELASKRQHQQQDARRFNFESRFVCLYQNRDRNTGVTVFYTEFGCRYCRWAHFQPAGHEE